MAINYFQESERYRPELIKTLLVGEAPPPSGEAYFYIPKAISNTSPIEMDRSLPSTIFNHYFQERPSTIDRYISFLLRLKENGMFLIDLCSEPIKVRGCQEGLMRIVEEIPKLRSKMADRDIHVQDRDIIFLLARSNYRKHIQQIYPDSQLFPWKDFRMCPQPLRYSHS